MSRRRAAFPEGPGGRMAERHAVTLRWRPFSGRSGTACPSLLPRRINPIDRDELANRVATLAAMEGWCSIFTKAAYAA